MQEQNDPGSKLPPPISILNLFTHCQLPATDQGLKPREPQSGLVSVGSSSYRFLDHSAGAGEGGRERRGEAGEDGRRPPDPPTICSRPLTGHNKQTTTTTTGGKCLEEDIWRGDSRQSPDPPQSQQTNNNLTFRKGIAYSKRTFQLCSRLQQMSEV